MYDLKLSVIFRRQIKKMAQNQQPVFCDVCENWDATLKRMNELGSAGNPFATIRFTSKVNRRSLYVVYYLDDDKKVLWVEMIAQKSKGRFVAYKP